MALRQEKNPPLVIHLVNVIDSPETPSASSEMHIKSYEFPES